METPVGVGAELHFCNFRTQGVTQEPRVAAERRAWLETSIRVGLVFFFLLNIWHSLPSAFLPPCRCRG